MLRSSEARNLPPAAAPVNNLSEIPVVPVAAAVPVEDVTTTAAAVPTTESAVTTAQPVKKNGVKIQSRARFAAPANEVIEVATEAPATAPVVAAPQIEKPKPVVTAASSQPNTALSPHLITPAKSAAPKSKVIQWP